MPEPNFHALRQVLEADVAPPPFDTIVDRRRRRTQRQTLAGAILATVAVLLAGLALRPPPSTKPAPLGPPTPSATAPVTTAQPLGPAPAPTVATLAATRSGTLYAIIATCTSRCTDVAAAQGYSLIRSANLGVDWTTAGKLTGLDPSQGAPHLLVADNTHLWVLSGSTMLVTTDGGQHWRSTGTRAATGVDDHFAGTAAGGTAWLIAGTRILRAGAGQFPAPTPGQLPAIRGLSEVTAISADEAVVRADPGDGLPPLWYRTTDRGAHWTRLPNPCLGTIAELSPFSQMAAGPDGTLWMVCARSAGAGQQQKEWVVSTDGGRTWQRKGALESTGEGTMVYPVGPKVAWRTGGRADVYRTTDGTKWTDVARTGEFGGVPFVALDSDTALYFRYGDTGDQMVEYRTRDGGHSWVTVAFNPPPA